MEKAVTAADANRKFSTLLRAVREGQTYIVTSHGRAVARVVPLEKNAGIARNARAALVKRLRSEPVVRVGRWSREELYEDQQ
jgi:prevent-host-death family protein